MVRVEPPQHDWLQHAKHHGCEVRTPYTARAVIMLAPDHWVAQDALRGVLVHGDFRTIDTYRESVPMVVQAAQHFLLGEGKAGSCRCVAQRSCISRSFAFRAWWHSAKADDWCSSDHPASHCARRVALRWYRSRISTTHVNIHPSSSGQLRAALRKSRRTCAQQKAKISSSHSRARLL